MMEENNYKYYCYSCEKQFASISESYSCLRCDSSAIESIKQQQQNSPSKFEIYELKTQRQSHQTLGILQNAVLPRGHGRTIFSIVSTTTTQDMGGIAEGSYLGNLLRQLLGQGNRLTAASQQQIQRLQKLILVKQCSICQYGEQEQVMQQQNNGGFKLSCNHTFHETCIRPWFLKANTCPVCRKVIS